MAATLTEDEDMPGKPPTDNSGLSIVSVAAAAASGLGVLGFVIFAGGVVLWGRFKAMGLSPDDAVSFVPRSELVATGADFLVPALLSATGIVVVLLAAKGILDYHRQSKGKAAAKPDDPANQQEKDDEEGAGEVEAAAGKGETPGAGAIRPPENTGPSSESLLPSSALAAVITAVAVFGVQVVVALFARQSSHLHFLPFLVLIGLAAAGAAVIGFALWLPNIGTAALGLIAFLAVGTFWVARAYEKTAAGLKVVPMAYSRQQPGRPTRIEFGYLVAETNDRIVFASLPKSRGNELREFPRSETDDLEIGALLPPALARSRAALFAYNLCNRVNAVAARPKRGKPALPCAGRYLAELAGIAGVTLPLHTTVTCHDVRAGSRCVVRFSGTTHGAVKVSLVRSGEVLTLGPRKVSHASVKLSARTKAAHGGWKAVVILTTPDQRQHRALARVVIR